MSRTLYSQRIGAEERMVELTTRKAGYRGPTQDQSQAAYGAVL